MSNESKWINVKDALPKDLETVWGINPKRNIAVLCCVVSFSEGWCWAISNGTTYIEDGKIVAECEDDDLDITHWMPLPEPPTNG